MLHVIFLKSGNLAGRPENKCDMQNMETRKHGNTETQEISEIQAQVKAFQEQLAKALDLSQAATKAVPDPELFALKQTDRLVSAIVMVHSSMYFA